METTYTIEELVQQVKQRLTGDNLGVLDAPDVRAIRWYNTLGMLPRTQHTKGRAYYTEAHVDRLVQIKRWQAQGLAVRQIQDRLLGTAPWDDLPGTPANGNRHQFWETAPPDAATAISVVLTKVTQPTLMILMPESAKWQYDATAVSLAAQRLIDLFEPAQDPS